MKYAFHAQAEAELNEAVDYYIIAVMQLNRRPGYWRHRVTEQ